MNGRRRDPRLSRASRARRRSTLATKLHPRRLSAMRVPLLPAVAVDYLIGLNRIRTAEGGRVTGAYVRKDGHVIFEITMPDGRPGYGVDGGRVRDLVDEIRRAIDHAKLSQDERVEITLLFVDKIDDPYNSIRRHLWEG